MKYRYVGDGPFPQHVIGYGIVEANGDVLETDTPINHKHFELLEEKKVKKDRHEGDE